mgnify:CR=1 FL=1
MRRERYQTHRRHHRGRTRHHSATPHTYSHHHTHVFTPFFSHTPIPHASDHERHEDTPPTPSPASAQPRTTPGPSPTDRAPARSSPGLPTPPHPLGPHGPARWPVWKCPSMRFAPSRGRPIGRRRRLERPEHAAHPAAGGAVLRGRGRGRAGRPEPLYLRPRGRHRLLSFIV